MKKLAISTEPPMDPVYGMRVSLDNSAFVSKYQSCKGVHYGQKEK